MHGKAIQGRTSMDGRVNGVVQPYTGFFVMLFRYARDTAPPGHMRGPNRMLKLPDDLIIRSLSVPADSIQQPAVCCKRYPDFQPSVMIRHILPLIWSAPAQILPQGRARLAPM